MKNCRFSLTFFGVLVVIGLATIRPAHAVLLTSFDFNNANFLASNGGLKSSTITPSFASDSYDNGANGPTAATNPRDMALQLYDIDSSGASNQNKYIQFGVDTTGYKSLMVSFATENVSSGFTGGSFQYSSDGTNFNAFQAYTTSTAYATKAFDLTSIAALNNDTKAAFRIVLTGGSTATTDTFAAALIDNLTVNATAVATPEPSTYAMMALGLVALGLVGGRRKRSENEAAN